MPGENVMKLGEQWEIEMPGFGKMTVSSQTNKQTDRQTNCQFKDRYKQTTDKQMVSSKKYTNLGKPKGDSKINLIPIQSRSVVTIFLQGVFMEHGDCFSSCMKIGEKTINVKGKVGEEKGS